MSGCHDCNDSNLGDGNRCGNPCNVTQSNTAACESLPSQIENFTLQFFGEVFKTEVDGKVTWSLPCGLDVGLPANPRGVDEGLACYFLRLFQNGITGLKGDKGIQGDPGIDGRNNYTVVLNSFSQPSLASPIVHVATLFNPTVLDGMYVFIDTSGWYLVTGSNGAGVLFLQLIQPLSGAPSTITAGKLVVPSGTPGATIIGPQGPRGIQGPQGPTGNNFTQNNGSFLSSGSNYSVTAIYSQVTFPAGNTALLLLPNLGTYLVTATTLFTGVGAVAAGNANTINLKLKNVSLGTDINGSEVFNNNMFLGYTRQLTISTLVNTTGANQSIGLFASAYANSVVEIESSHTFMHYVQLA